MAFKCAWCGSLDTQALADRYVCSICGRHTGTRDGAAYDSPGPRGGPEVSATNPDAELD